MPYLITYATNMHMDGGSVSYLVLLDLLMVLSTINNSGHLARMEFGSIVLQQL